MRKFFQNLTARVTDVARILYGHPRRLARLEPVTPLSRIEGELAGNGFLRSVCESRPQAFGFPLRRSKTAEFVIVWLHFREECVTRINLFDAIQTALRVIHESELLAHYKAIEVVPFAGKNLAGEGRILRASSSKKNLSQVARLSEHDFIGAQTPGFAGWQAMPLRGFYVSWYKNPLEIAP